MTQAPQYFRPHHTGQTSRPWDHQSGASLIEVLVAILLVTVGLLGVAGLSGATFAYNKTAQIRLVGMGLVNDYADRARVNIYGFDRGKYTIALNDAAPTAVTFDEIKANQTVAESAADDVAQYDRRDFLLAIGNWLPQGKAVVETNASDTGRGMDIWLLWKEPQNESDALFTAGQANCPPTLSKAEQAVYSCMYFKVGL